MLEVSTKLILGSAVLLAFYYWFTKMAKAGSPLFKIGYGDHAKLTQFSCLIFVTVGIVCTQKLELDTTITEER